MRDSGLREISDYTFDVAERLFHSGSADGTRFHGGDANTEGAQFETQRVGEQTEGALAGVEQSAEGDRDVRADGTDVHDPAVGFANERKKSLGDGDLTEDVNVENFLHGLSTDIFHGSNLADSSDIDQRVECSVFEL